MHQDRSVEDIYMNSILTSPSLSLSLSRAHSAYDILSNKKRRCAFDSVDPTFDDSIPPNSAYSKDHFFEVFGRAFSDNERQDIISCVTVGH